MLIFTFYLLIAPVNVRCGSKIFFGEGLQAKGAPYLLAEGGAIHNLRAPLWV